MTKYLFQYTSAPAGNSRDFWIDANGSAVIDAEDLNSAVENFIAHMKDKHYFDFSVTAKKRKNWVPCYIDKKDGSAEQIGFIFKANTEFEFEQGWRIRFIDVWTTVHILTKPKF